VAEDLAEGIDAAVVLGWQPHGDPEPFGKGVAAVGLVITPRFWSFAKTFAPSPTRTMTKLAWLGMYSSPVRAKAFWRYSSPIRLLARVAASPGEA
jgi:hypothetical protein